MPLIVITPALAVLVGPFVPRRIALGVTTVAAAVTLLSFIWSTVDGKGNDPWWTALVGATAAGIAIALLPPGPDSSAEEFPLSLTVTPRGRARRPRP